MDGRGDRRNSAPEGPQLNLYPRLIINGDAPPVNPVLNAILEPIEFLVDVGLVDTFSGRRQLLQQPSIQPVNNANNNVVYEEDNAEVPLVDLTGSSCSEDDKAKEVDNTKMRWWDEFLDSESDCNSETESIGCSYMDCIDVCQDGDTDATVDLDYCKYFAEKESPGEYKKSCEDEGEHKP